MDFLDAEMMILGGEVLNESNQRGILRTRSEVAVSLRAAGGALLDARAPSAAECECWSMRKR